MSEPLRLLALIGPVTIVTVLSSIAARTLVRRAPLVHTMVAIAVVASSVTALDMVILNHYMLLEPGHWVEVALVVAYSLSAAVAAAMIVGRSTEQAISQLASTAQALGANRLDARAGSLNASPELQLLGATLDRAAARLAEAIESERLIESQRRDLMTAISHDLRTPLASIRATVEAINDGVVDDPETVRRYAGEMLSAVLGLVEMVDDLFELSQLDAREFAEDPRRLTVAEVIDRAAGLARHEAALRGVSLEIAIENAALRSCSPKLVRVVHSLIDNAVRYTPRGGRVRVYAATSAAGELRVSVEDDGPGISRDQLARVFEPFWRADDARSTRGSGLGLALAKRIVEALGGRIEASSTLREGSRFEVSLPLSGRRAW